MLRTPGSTKAETHERIVERPEGGCTLAALGTETARQAPGLCRVATRSVTAMARLLAEQLPSGDTENRARWRC